MAEERVQRRLAAILAAAVVGYSLLTCIALTVATSVHAAEPVRIGVSLGLTGRYAKLAAMLGWGTNFPKKLAPAIVFPFAGTNGQAGYCRAKPDTPRTIKKKPIKYESPRGQDNQVFVPPGTRGVLNNAEAELLVTEGEKKSAKADQEGFPCIGLVGTYGHVGV